MDEYSPYTDSPDNNCDQNASWNNGVCHKQDHKDYSVVYDYHRDGHLLHLVDSHQIYDFHNADNGDFLYW